MTQPYLEISYRHGKPFLVYLYLARRAKVAKSRQKGQLVIDFATDGSVLGIELLAFDPATIATLQTELQSLGLTKLAESELRPILAA